MEKLFTYLKHTFGDETKGPKWGAILGTGLLTLIAGAVGFFTGGGMGAGIVGAIIGLTGGALAGDALNDIGKKMGLASNTPAKGPLMVDVPTAERGLATLKTIKLEQGAKTSINVEMPVPNMNKFEKVSETSRGLVAELNDKRQKTDRLNEATTEHDGAVKLLTGQESKAFQLLANAQEWNNAAAKWNNKDGGRDKAAESFLKVKAALGQKADASVVPQMPVFEVKLPQLPADLRQYAVNMYVGAGKGASEKEWEADYPQPQQKLHYLAKVVKKEVGNEPDWNVLAPKRPGVLSTISNTISESIRNPIAAGAIVPAGAVATAAVMLSKFGYNNEDAEKAKEAYEKNDFKAAMSYAEAGKKHYNELLTNTPKEGKNNQEIIAFVQKKISAFHDFEAHLKAKQMETRVVGLRNQMYEQIGKLERDLSVKLPQYTRQVEVFQAEVDNANKNMHLHLAMEKANKRTAEDAAAKAKEGVLMANAEGPKPQSGLPNKHDHEGPSPN